MRAYLVRVRARLGLGLRLGPVVEDARVLVPRREKVVEDRPLRVLGSRLTSVAVARVGAWGSVRGIGIGDVGGRRLARGSLTVAGRALARPLSLGVPNESEAPGAPREGAGAELGQCPGGV